MRTFLAEPKPMAKSLAAKNKVRTGASYLETRTLQEIPTEYTAHNDLEFPSAYRHPSITFERD
jgi:hypothetical protein